MSSSGRKLAWWKFGGNHSIVDVMKGTLRTTSSGNRIARTPNGFSRLAAAAASPKNAVSPTTRHPAARRPGSTSSGRAVPSPAIPITRKAITKPAWRLTQGTTRAGTRTSVTGRRSQPGRRSQIRIATNRYVKVWGRACQNSAPVHAARSVTADARRGWTPRARIVPRTTPKVATTVAVFRPISASRPQRSQRSVNRTCVAHMWLIHGRPSAV